MYLVDKEIKKLIDEGVLNDASATCVDSVSCDLHIKYIVGQNNSELSYAELEPGDTVMIATEESIALPDDMLGIIIQKNSRLRTGLSVNAPVYRPGHKTRIFMSVSNLSGAKIEIVSGEEIAAIMFEQLSQKPTQVYTGGFQDENKYKGLGDYTGKWDTKIKKIEDKYQSIKDLEKSIYGNVLVIITIFLGLFSLLNFEIAAVQNLAYNVMNIIRYNLIYLGSMSLLVCMANLVLPYGSDKKYMPFIIPAVCIVLAIILTFVPA